VRGRKKHKHTLATPKQITRSQRGGQLPMEKTPRNDGGGGFRKPTKEGGRQTGTLGGLGDFFKKRQFLLKGQNERRVSDVENGLQCGCRGAQNKLAHGGSRKQRGQNR